MKILVLYSQIASYFFACLEHLVENYDVEEVLLFSYKPIPDVPVEITSTKGIKVVYVEDISNNELINISIEFRPDLVYVSGWNIREYMKVCKVMKTQGLPVLLGLDNPWTGSIRQFLGALYYRLFIAKCVSHIWAAGIGQYEFARYLGVDKRRIIMNLYCADIKKFSKNVTEVLDEKRINYPNRILFVGRLVNQKGVGELVNAFETVSSEFNTSWELILVGNGALKSKIGKQKNILVVDFCQPNNIVKYFNSSGFFCLPSKIENWGVVVHEAVSAGLPVVVSDACESGWLFVKDGVNGFRFKTGSQSSLENSLRKMMSMRKEDLLRMSLNSVIASKQISQDVWAANLISLIDYKMKDI